MKIKDPGSTVRAFDDPLGLCQNLKNVVASLLAPENEIPHSKTAR